MLSDKRLSWNSFVKRMPWNSLVKLLSWNLMAEYCFQVGVLSPCAQRIKEVTVPVMEAQIPSTPPLPLANKPWFNHVVIWRVKRQLQIGTRSFKLLIMLCIFPPGINPKSILRLFKLPSIKNAKILPTLIILKIPGNWSNIPNNFLYSSFSLPHNSSGTTAVTSIFRGEIFAQNFSANTTL